MEIIIENLDFTGERFGVEPCGLIHIGRECEYLSLTLLDKRGKQLCQLDEGVTL